MCNQAMESLIDICVNAIANYDPINQGLHTYTEVFLKNLSYALSDSDKQFVTELLGGVVYYRSVLDVVVDGLYASDGMNFLRSERPLYQVLSYLAIFRLEEIGIDIYKDILMKCNIFKAYKFANVLFNEKNLITWIKSEWLKRYDASFVEEKLLQQLIRNLPELTKFVRTLKLYTENKVQRRKKSASTTEIIPFNLTKPTPIRIPIPAEIPQVPPHNPVPQTTYKDPEEFERMKAIKVLNRKRAERIMVKAENQPFRCAFNRKSDKTLRRIQQIEMEEKAKCDFHKFRAHDATNSLSTDVTFKLNTAAILREGKLYKKKEEKTIKELNDLEAGCRDLTAFLEWQNAARQKDYDKQLEEIERKKYLGKLSYEEAILAKQKLVETNKTKVQEMKKEATAMMKEYLDKRLKDEQIMRQLVETIAMGRANTKDAKKKLQLYKHKIVQEVNNETKELLKIALERAEEEMKRKMELINEIRALEANPANRTKLVDLTSTAGYGFLNELSIFELRERLSLMKEKLTIEVENKRDEILKEKTVKQQGLMDTMKMISKHRDESAKAAARSLVERRQKSDVKEKSKQALEFERELMEKRAQRVHLREKNRISSAGEFLTRTKLLQLEQQEMEKHRWKDLEERQKNIANLASPGCDLPTKHLVTLPLG